MRGGRSQHAELEEHKTFWGRAMQGGGSSISVWESVCAGSWAPAAGSGSAARQEFLFVSEAAVMADDRAEFQVIW